MIICKKMPGIFLFLAVSCFRMYGQFLPVSSGGEASGVSGSASITAGLPVFSYLSGSNTTVTSGVQQPFEISAVSGINDPRIDISFSLYPNPSSDVLMLEISNDAPLPLAASLFDEQGGLLKQWDINSYSSMLKVSDLKSAVYFLRISDKEIVLKTFKILKK